MNKKNNILEKQASIEHEDGFNKQLIHYRARTIIDLCHGPSILELGCGDGLVTKELVKYFDVIVSVDGSSIRLNRAINLVDSIENKKADVTFHVSLFENFESNTNFDTIIASGVLEHVNDPIQILKKAKSWLNTDGSIIIVVPNAESIHRRIGRIMGIISDIHELKEHDFAVGHKRYYDIDMLREDVLKSGLDIESIGGIFLKAMPNAQMERMETDLIDAFYEVGKELLPDYCAEIWVKCVPKKG